MSDQRLALDKYRRKVATYDDSNRFGRLRRQCVDLLALNPGDVVLDVGCGTGLNFPLIQAAIAEQGSLIGVDLSPDMLALARDRVSQSNWHNVTLINSSVEAAHIPEHVDAALFSLTHDVMRSPPALQNVMRSVKRGGRVVAVGRRVPLGLEQAEHLTLSEQHLRARERVFGLIVDTNAEIAV